MNAFKISLDLWSKWGYLDFEQVQNNKTEDFKAMPHSETTILVTYILYLFISVALTIWVGHTLHKCGAIFLVDAFHGNAELAASVNHLLVVGFYLVNIGFVSLALKSDADIVTSRSAIELLSNKLGYVLVSLGGMHFFNLFLFSQIRSHAKSRAPQRPPVMPDAVLKVAIPR